MKIKNRTEMSTPASRQAGQSGRAEVELEIMQQGRNLARVETHRDTDNEYK